MIQATLTEDSILILCPQCFDCWARLPGRDTSYWRHRYIPCAKHPQAAFAYGCDVSGSLLELEDLSLDSLPLKLLSREFRLTMSNLTEST